MTEVSLAKATSLQVKPLNARLFNPTSRLLSDLSYIAAAKRRPIFGRRC